MRQLHLQAAFAGGGPFAEDFENERGAVQHLGVPGLLQIALLHRAKLGVDDDNFRLMQPCQIGDFLDLARTWQRGGNRPGQRRDQRFPDAHTDGGGQADAPRPYVPPHHAQLYPRASWVRHG